MIKPEQILGAIIAGGQATRMGGENKALKMLGPCTLAEHIALRLRSQVPGIIINVNRDLDAFDGLGGATTIIQDADGLGAGPLAGLLQCLLNAQKAAGGVTHLVSVAGDTPFFPVNLVSALTNTACEKGTIIIARSGGFPQPIFGLWPVALADDLQNWLSAGRTNKVMAWVRAHPHSFVDFEIENNIDPFFNINTPDDLAQATLLLEKAKL